MTHPWAWIYGTLAAGLIGTGFWLNTLEQKTGATVALVQRPAPLAENPPSEPEPIPPVAATPEPELAEIRQETAPPTLPATSHWLYAMVPGLAPDVIDDVMQSVARSSTVAVFYGAVASPRAHILSHYITEGYGELAQAEKHALEICENAEADCVIVAWLVPTDWDGIYEGTLGARQIVLWDDFNAEQSDRNLAFAASLEGAAGIGTGPDADQAASAALAACRQQQDRLRLPGISIEDCSIVATRPADR